MDGIELWGIPQMPFPKEGRFVPGRGKDIRECHFAHRHSIIPIGVGTGIEDSIDSRPLLVPTGEQGSARRAADRSIRVVVRQSQPFRRELVDVRRKVIVSRFAPL